MSSACRRRRRELLRYADGELPLEKAFDFERHLESCDGCRREASRQLHIDEALLSLPRPFLSEQELAGLQDKVLDSELLARAHVLPEATRGLRLRVVGLAAAILLLLLGAVATFEFAPRSIPDPEVATAPLGDVVEIAEEHPAAEGSSTETASARGFPGPVVEGTSEFVYDAAQVRARRQRLAELLVRAPGDAFIEPYLAELDVGRSSALELLARDLAELLQDTDPAGAGRAIDGLATLALLGEISVPNESVRALEWALRDPPLAGAAVQALAAVATRDACQVLACAVEDPLLRRPALLALLAVPGNDLEATRSRLLVRLLRSPLEGDRDLLEEALAVLPFESVTTLKLLVTLYREGGERSQIAGLAVRLSGPALQAWCDSLGDDGVIPTRDALSLASLAPRVELSESLLAGLEAGRDVAPRAEALARLHGPEGWVPLLTVLGDVGIPISRRRVIEASLREELRVVPESTILETFEALGEQARDEEALLEQCRALGGARATQVLLAVASRPQLSISVRTSAGRLLASDVAPPDAASLVDVLAALDVEPDTSASLCSSLLVALYHFHGQRGLEDGCRVLDLPCGGTAGHELARRVRRAADRGGAPRSHDLERIAAAFPASFPLTR